jgi:hypothetical protein
VAKPIGYYKDKEGRTRPITRRKDQPFIYKLKRYKREYGVRESSKYRAAKELGLSPSQVDIADTLLTEVEAENLQKKLSCLGIPSVKLKTGLIISGDPLYTVWVQKGKIEKLRDNEKELLYRRQLYKNR